jgi:PAS domain S-box-containing protein
MMRRLADLLLVLCVNPGKACTESDVMMARVSPDGLFELLSAAAWARALGYAPEELSGKSLSELMQLSKPAAARLAAALLDGWEDGGSVDVTLRCKDGRLKSFRLHRRFDPYQRAMYIVADELPEGRAAPLSAYA